MLRINDISHDRVADHPPPVNQNAMGHQAQNNGDRFQAVTAYRFVGEEDNELSFEANETIFVYVNYEGRYNLNEPWWYGEINRQGRGSVRGLFPSNYITVTDQVRQRYRIRTPTGAGY